MKRIIALVLVAFTLSACGPQLEALKTAVKFGAASVQNPVTKDRLREVEAGVTILFVGLNAWRSSCVRGLIPDTCEQQIRTVQIYTMQIPPYLKELRRFVRQNDQVNAVVVFNELTSIIALVKAKGAESGVNLEVAR